jgi:hypothetical protein
MPSAPPEITAQPAAAKSDASWKTLDVAALVAARDPTIAINRA